jgi:multidrug resistance efflux pump
MSEETKPVTAPDKAEGGNRVRRITLIVGALVLIFFTYGMIADRFTPSTSQATVQAYLIQIAPDVAGRVVEVMVRENKRMEPGEPLFRIDSEPYQLAVDRAQATLELAGQTIGSSTAAVAAAEAQVAEATAKRVNVRAQGARVLELVQKGIYPKARGDQADAELKSADAAVAQAMADLERARQTLGPKGDANPQIRDAIAALRDAQRDLKLTTVYAPAAGGVPYLELAVGQYLSVGKAAMTYVDIEEVWIEAAFRENSLEHIEIGTPVMIALDLRPGRVYRGKITTIGYGVSSRNVDQDTGLPKLSNPSGWIREPQPMPVRVTFDEPRPLHLRVGSQATVMAFTGDNLVLNGIAWARIWLRAFLSYVS